MWGGDEERAWGGEYQPKDEVVPPTTLESVEPVGPQKDAVPDYTDFDYDDGLGEGPDLDDYSHWFQKLKEQE